MASVKFDNTEIVNTTYVPRFIKHESTSDREVAILGLAREDGGILIAEKYNEKRILVAGTIKASTQTALENAVDTFKELFSRKEKNLDIGWAGSTRRYVATCTKHEFDRDYIHIGFIPWTAEFVAPLGIGKDTSLTAVINAVGFNVSPYTSSVTFAGSAQPRPIITLTIGAGLAATVLGFSFENTDTDEKIIIVDSSGFTTSDVVEIDCENKTVKKNGVAATFHGVFPSFVIGVSNFEINTGRIIDQQFGDGTYDATNGPNDDVWVAQSFMVPEKDVTYKTIAFYGLRSGSTGNLDFAIQTDSAGKPSGSIVTNASVTVAEGTVSTSNAWQVVEFANAFTLSANTKYWLVIKALNAVGGSYLAWRYRSGVNATYKRGNGAVTTNAGVTWTDYPDRDFLFRIYYGGLQDATPDLTLDIDYYKRFL